MQVIYTVCADKDEANIIGRALVEQELAACTNAWTINSVYKWEGEVHDEEEVAMIIKTRIKNVSAVFEKVKELHSYDTPALFVLPTGVVDQSYLEWVRDRS
jgi:periplasmic divalent cation tolerance protein